MFSFLSVSQGSEQPPKFLHMTLKADPKLADASKGPIVLVGKGVTFDRCVCLVF